MLKWVSSAKNDSSEKKQAKVNDATKPKKKVTFCETVLAIPDQHDKLKFLFNLGYRKDIQLRDNDEVHMVTLSNEGVITKTTLKP